MNDLARTAEPVSVELTIPVQADLVVLARLTVATVASRVGFGVEDIEDLRLAVEELCLSLVAGADAGRLHLRFDCEPDAITVDCQFEPPAGRPVPETGGADDLSLRIIEALVDDHGRELRQGHRCAWLRKRRDRSPV